MVEMLLEAGASTNSPDRKGNSAIHLAAIRKDVKILQLLSKAKTPLPDFNGKNFTGTGPTYIICTVGQSPSAILELWYQWNLTRLGASHFALCRAIILTAYIHNVLIHQYNYVR